VADQPDATLAELGTRLDRPFGTSTMDLWLRRLGLSYKKTMHAAEQHRPDVAEQRARWHGQLASEPAARLVFVDESGTNTKMTRVVAAPRRRTARQPCSAWTLSNQHTHRRRASGRVLRSVAV